MKTVAYRIHTILTDNASQSAEQPQGNNTAYSREMRSDMISEATDLAYRQN